MDLFPTYSACKKEKSVKRKGEDHHDSCIEVEDKKKIGPSHREAEVVMRFYCWMHKILMRKNVTLYCRL